MWKFDNRVNVSLALDESLLARVDHWRFVNRINTRSEAMRMLIERGLNAGNLPPKPKLKRAPTAKKK